jgi:hypothetical protein
MGFVTIDKHGCTRIKKSIFTRRCRGRGEETTKGAKHTNNKFVISSAALEEGTARNPGLLRKDFSSRKRHARRNDRRRIGVHLWLEMHGWKTWCAEALLLTLRRGGRGDETTKGAKWNE